MSHAYILYHVLSRVMEGALLSDCLSFSNGRVDCSSSGAKTRHSLYQEKGRKRRTLVTKTDHVTYTGSNYETEATMSDLPFRK